MTIRDPTVSKVYLIIAMFIALSFSMVLLLRVQENALVAVRSYVEAEGLWAKAQKDATRSLERYAHSRSESDYKLFLDFIQVPLGDLQARIELQKPNPNLDIARQGFLQGGNHPEDIEYMIDLFLRFQRVDFMAEAIRHWTSADMFISELSYEANKLHEEIISNSNNYDSINSILLKLETINERVTEQENLFSFTLAKASRLANQFSRAATYIIALGFIVIGAGLSWPIIVRIQKSKEAEFIVSKQRDKLLLELETINNNALIGIMVTSVDRVILRINRYLEVTMLGYQSGELAMKDTSILYPTQLIYDAVRRDVYEQLTRSKSCYPYETIFARKDGSTFLARGIGSFVDPEDPDEGLIWLISDITEERAAEDQIKELAFYDPLTKLPNRRLLIDRLSQALASSARSGRDGALLFIDLDNFKAINDTKGHDIGDQLLQEVAIRLSNNFREVDTVARIGGDEFVVVLADLHEVSEEAAALAEGVAQKILSVLGVPYRVSGAEFITTPSIGITLFGVKRTIIDDIMKQADIAMYQAKSAGRNTWRFFNPDLQSTIQARVSMQEDLSQGMKDGQFFLYFQPQVGAGGHLTGAEALLRWQHPLRGMVSPGEFIPLAEESGLILQLGNWVLDTACAQLSLWAKHPDLARLTISVNVSAKQFRQSDFVDQVVSAYKRTPCDPRQLKLELTESLLVENVQDIIEKMSALKSEGLSFSLDDFGTGYSSLSYLKRLPLDQLKIDQSFVRDVLTDPNDAVIAKTIVALAQSLGLGVIAEGVETSEQRDFLASIGCPVYQGYFLSRPLPADQFEQFVFRHNNALTDAR